MQLPDNRGQLTYCLNIHPTQTWEEVQAALTGPVRAVKAAVSPDTPFAVGLRFSAEAAHALASFESRAELMALLDRERYTAISVNGFPYGPFHGTSVKEQAYQPDWRSEERLAYTKALADLMASIAPAGEHVSLSTVPGTFKPLSVGAEADMAENLLRAVAHCVALKQRTAVSVAIALEPEPFCFLETIAETIAYFEQYLYSDIAVQRLAELSGLSATDAASALPEHLGVCYDVCHAAVEFEDPVASISALRDAGIPVHKLQLSTALRIVEVDAEARAALAAFNESTYLHQVVACGEHGLARYADLPEVLARGAAGDGEEWRIHFHVPIFAQAFGALGTTQPFLEEILALHRREPISAHLEVETYSWNVLPEALRHDKIEDAVVRELRWVMERLA
ncbi:MAG: metabolite traffic protein EboE [Halomonas sp.]|nr:metabolite traffic protein EboE [Halomonas sp.]